MELLLVLVALIVIIILYNNANHAQKQSFNILEDKLNSLSKQIQRLQEELKAAPKPEKVTPEPPKAPVVQEVKPELKPQPTYKPFTPPPPVVTPVKNELKEVPPPRYEPMHEVKEGWFDKWLRNNPDLEKFIGENLVNKIGIAVLVLGIAFFVKYAIDKEWINEIGRVSIGLFCGAVLIGIAHYMRNSFRAFSSVLAGGGIAVFYFTIAFAFHQYSLISQTAAFVIMVVITAFAIALAVLYDKVELAVIATIGGFLTPFLVSTGQGNYIVLFTYIIILNTGLLFLSFFKRWPIINILAFFFTLFIYGGWLTTISLEVNPNVSYPQALLFLTILYLLFMGMNMIYQIRHKTKFKAFDYSILLLLNASYYAAGLVLLAEINDGQFNGLFTLSVGLVNLVLAWYFFKREQTDKNLLYLLIGLTLTFLSLAIPVQLKGHAITLFWSAEFVLLFWLYQRSRINIFYYSSLLVSFLALISLVIDWAQAATSASSALLLIYTDVQGFVTNVVAVAAFAAFGMLIRKEQHTLPAIFNTKDLRNMSFILAAIICYITAVAGVNLYFSNLPNYEVPNVYHRLLTLVAAGIITIWQYREKDLLLKPVIAVTGGYLLFHLFSFSLIQGMRDGVLTGKYPFVHQAMHLVSVGITLYLVFQAISVVRKSGLRFFSFPIRSWILSLLVIIFISQEAVHLFVIFLYQPNRIDYLENQYMKAVLTIVWALCSFGLMWLGMRFKNKTLRIISLSVFCLALVKLFFFDIVNVSEGGKIAAFILLGVLLLVVSFMYQRVKKMIIDDAKS